MATEQAVSSPPIAQQAVRREAMAVLAASDTEELDALLAAAGELPRIGNCASRRAGC